jgi:hypothetical protein
LHFSPISKTQFGLQYGGLQYGSPVAPWWAVRVDVTVATDQSPVDISKIEVENLGFAVGTRIKFVAIDTPVDTSRGCVSFNATDGDLLLACVASRVWSNVVSVTDERKSTFDFDYTDGLTQNVSAVGNSLFPSIGLVNYCYSVLVKDSHMYRVLPIAYPFAGGLQRAAQSKYCGMDGYMADLDSNEEQVAIDRLRSQTLTPLTFEAGSVQVNLSKPTLTSIKSNNADHAAMSIPMKDTNAQWVPVAMSGHANVKLSSDQTLPRFPGEEQVRWYVADGPNEGAMVWSGAALECAEACNATNGGNGYRNEDCCTNECSSLLNLDPDANGGHGSNTIRTSTFDVVATRCFACVKKAQHAQLCLFGGNISGSTISTPLSCGRSCGFITKTRSPDSRASNAGPVSIRNPPWAVNAPSVHGRCVEARVEQSVGSWTSRPCTAIGNDLRQPAATVVEFSPTYKRGGIISAPVIPDLRYGVVNPSTWMACGPGGLCSCPSVVKSDFFADVQRKSPTNDSLYHAMVDCAGRHLIEAPVLGGVLGPRSSDVDMTGGFAPLAIDFSNNDLVAIPDGHFDYIESHVRLEGITLNHNLITTLPIVESERLLVLSLRFNQLGRLNLDDLAGVPNLVSLDLRNNMITAVDGSSFPESLLNLDLRANSIRGVSISAIDSLPMGLGAELRFRHDGDFRHVPGSKHDESTTVCKPRRLDWKMGFFDMGAGSWGCCCARGYSDLITPPALTNERCSLTPLYAGANTSLFNYFGCVVASSTAVLPTTAATASTTKSNKTESNTKFSGSRAGTASAVIIAAAVLMGIICAAIVAARRCNRRSLRSRTDLHASAALLSKLRPCSEAVTVAEAKIASKFVAFARKRAEARFVIEYRQLVSTDSMEAFQVQFSQLEIPRSSVTIGSELGRGQSGVVFSGCAASSDERMAV